MRRKRKADVRLWVGLGDEGIAGPVGEEKRKDGEYTLGIGFLLTIKALHVCYRLGYLRKSQAAGFASMDVKPLIPHREHPAR